MTGGKCIKLRVVGEDGGEIPFIVKKTTPLSKLMRWYCESKGVGVTSLRFFFDGLRIGNSDTAEDVGLTENDEIEAFTGLGGNKRWVECYQLNSCSYVLVEGMLERFLTSRRTTKLKCEVFSWIHFLSE